MKKIYLCILLLTSQSLMATSASNRLWVGANSVQSVSEMIEFQIVGELRYNTEIGETAQSVVLFGPHYKLNKNHKIALLYGIFQSPVVAEHRFNLQHQQNYGEWIGFNWSGRTRIAGRYLEDSSDDSLRFRYVFRLLEKTDRKYKILIWNEFFINFTDDVWTGNRTFERNRGFIGARIMINKTKLDIGYMNEFIPRTSGDRVEHILNLSYHL